MPSQERDWSSSWSSQDPYTQYPPPMTQGHHYYSSEPFVPVEKDERPTGLPMAYSHYYAEPLGSSYHYEPPAAPASFVAPPYYQPATGSEGYSGSHEYSSYNYSYPSAPAQEPLHPSHATSSSARPSPPFPETRPPPILSFAAGTSQPAELSQSTSIPEHLYYSRVQQNDGRAFYGTSAAAFSRPERPLEQRQDPTWAATAYHPYKLPGSEPALLADPAPAPPAPASAPLERRSLSAGSPQLSERSVGSDEDRGERHDAVTPFVSKLSHMLNNPEYNDVIRWNRDGNAFTFAHSSPEFLTVLGTFFRHSNVHSFVRQLNIYAFTRLTSLDLVEALEGTSYSAASDFSGFFHPQLFRDSPDRVCDLTKIKPKIAKKPPRARSNPQLAPDVRKHTIKTDGGKVSGGAKGRKMS